MRAFLEKQVATFKHYFVKTPQNSYNIDICGDGSGYSGKYQKLTSHDPVNVEVGDDFESGPPGSPERTMHYLLCRCISEIEKNDGPVTVLIDLPGNRNGRSLH